MVGPARAAAGHALDALHALSADLAHLGLTASEINALANLADGRARTVSELGAAAGTRPTTLTSVLDRLEGRGLIRRTSAQETARAVLIELAGERTAATIWTAITDLEHRALATLPAATIAALRSALQPSPEASS